jgi:hypothetical protein
MPGKHGASSRLRLVDLALRIVDNLTREDPSAAIREFTRLRTISIPILAGAANDQYPQVAEYAQNIFDYLTDWRDRLNCRLLKAVLAGRSLQRKGQDKSNDGSVITFTITFADESNMTVKSSGGDTDVSKWPPAPIKGVSISRANGPKILFDFEGACEREKPLCVSLANSHGSDLPIVVRDREGHVLYPVSAHN